MEIAVCLSSDLVHLSSNPIPTLCASTSSIVHGLVLMMDLVDSSCIGATHCHAEAKLWCPGWSHACTLMRNVAVGRVDRIAPERK
eukprot:4068088-Amphidinium_carterae.1